MNALIPPQKASDLISQHLPLSLTISCPLNKCAGRILRQDIQADRPFPPFNRSMMDGYALSCKDLEQTDTFRIVGEAPAGAPSISRGKETGTCVEIMTGAVVPDDADCVIPYEQTDRIDAHRIKIHQPTAHESGDYIHKKGMDATEGMTLLHRGSILGSREIAVAASCGYTKLSVSKIPKIAIVTTGDELVDVSKRPDPHQVRRSNDACIESALASAHIKTHTFQHLPDAMELSKKVLSELVESHSLVIITGGISMGKKDYIPQILAEMQFSCAFHGISQKPGKPMGFWHGPSCSLFTLPGNPLSTLTCVHQYVLPAVKQAMGLEIASEKPTVKISHTLRARDDLTIFLPVKLQPLNYAEALAANNSGDLVNILHSDGYIEVDPTPDKSYSADSRFYYTSWL